MSFPGLGDQDWVELDLEQFDLDRHAGVVDRLEAVRRTLVDLVGEDYAIETAVDGSAHVLASGQRRFHAEINASGRLILTRMPDPQGPL